MPKSLSGQRDREEATRNQETAARLREERRRAATDEHRQAANRILLFIFVDLVLLSGYLMTGAVSVTEVTVFGILGVCEVGFFRFAIARGWHLLNAGVGLSFGITCLFSAHILGFAFYVPQVGVLMLMLLITVIAMTALTLPVKYTAMLCTVIGLCAAVLMHVRNTRLTMPMGSWPEQVLSALWFALLLGRGALLNLKGRELRVALGRESAALAEALDQLEHSATRDELTGVPNRRAAMNVLSEELARSRRTGRPFSVALFDVDKFKQINDLLGHGAGDQVLMQFASVASAAVRDTDCFSRFGGEEFLLIMPEQLNPDSAALAADRLRRLIEQYPWSTIDQNLVVTVSAGVSTLNGLESAEQLIARADKGLYVAKNEGRNRVCIG
ncbi:GGDEF domain-containing protein [Marinobacter halodurans]|uniref:diguanylate cyclase n=1 Tax=Marinobacter halodurans TaxID=2528979 RepID=A0ABY1ZMJ9_9GAMM|nr:GGDEF domain-containing protein [Marinobacter halodurans]TBW57622.1 GGDEF domain-containing protein [Marinobacter halodurans]